MNQKRTSQLGFKGGPTQGRSSRKVRTRWAALVAAMLAVAAIVVTVGTGIVSANAQDGAYDKVADASTSGTYTETLGETHSTRYAGRVWTDKSVSTESVTFTGDTGDSGITVDIGESDFLVTYSALATSQEITQLPKVPVDVVFVLDLSGSMNWSERGTEVEGNTNQEAFNNSRLKGMVEALNSSIDALVKDNENNRIGIVVFNGSASTLMELTSASQIAQNVTDGNYLQVTKFEIKPGSSGRQEADATVRCNINNQSTDTAGGTNIQAGMDLGMSMLSDESETTFTYGEDTYTRIPNVVLMSDGAPTTFASALNASWDDGRGQITSSTSVDEPIYSGSWWSDLVTSAAIGSGDVDNAHSADGFMALLTASYKKNEITNHYKSNAEGAKNTDQAVCSVYTIGFSTDIQTDSMVAMANMVLNPEDNLTAASDIRAINELRNAWEVYEGTGTVTVSGQIGSSSSVRNYTVQLPTNDDNNPTSLYYADEYFYASNASDLNDAFQQITNAITESAKAPTEIVGGNPVQSGYITYTDPIGQYMHVDDVPTIVYAGRRFNKTDSTTTDKVTTYTFSGEVSSPVYGDHSINEIEVQVTTNNDGSQTLTVKIPASVIPLLVNYVEVNADGTVNSNTVNDSPYPIRVLYTVSLNDDVIDENGEISSNVSSEYIASHLSDDGKVLFYSNAYDGTEGVTDKTAGNATVTFTPARDNPFYFFQSDVPLYTGGTAGVIGQGGTLGTPATGELDVDQTYYFEITYYEGNNVVRNVIARTGAELNGYVGTAENDNLYIKAGTPRLGNISNFIADKVANATETADTYRYPEYENGSFVVYLGNNGKLGVDFIEKDVSYPSDPSTSIDGQLVSVGSTLRYTIEWVNTSNQAERITVTDKLPYGTAFVEGSAHVYDSNGVDKNVQPDTPDARTIEWKFNAAAYERGTVVFEVKVTDAAINNIDNDLANNATITIGANKYTTNTTHNYVPEKTVGTSAPPSTSINGQTVRVGDKLTYTIYYRNTEDAPATVTVKDSVPAGTEFESASGVYSQSGNNLTWEITNVAAGATGTVSFTVRVTEAAASTGTVENTATVQIGENDPLVTNEVENPVAVKTATSGDVNVDGGSVNVGDEITFAISYTNVGAEAAEVTITDAVPAGTEFVSAPGDIKPDANGNLTWTLDAASGETVTATFTVRVTATSGKVENTAGVQVNNDPSVTTNTTTTDIVTPASAQIPVSKTFAGWTNGAENHSFQFALTGKLGTEPGTGSTVTLSKDSPSGNIGITYTEAGTYYYTMSEVNDGLYGVTYSSAVYDVVVTVSKANNALSADVSITPSGEEGTAVGTATFENGWTPGTQAKDVVTADGTSIDGNTVAVGDELTYVISWSNTATDESGKPVDATVTVTDAAPAGTELVGTPAGATVDNGTITWTIDAAAGGTGTVSFKVRVTEAAASTGTVENTATVQIGENGPTIETNKVTNDVPKETTVASTDIQFTKTFTGHEWTSDYSFDFVLTPVDGAPMPEGTNPESNTKTVTVSGPDAGSTDTATFDFGSITYAQPGTYTYTVTEVNGGKAGVTYDTDNTATVTVTVSVDEKTGDLAATAVVNGGAFKNTYATGTVDYDALVDLQIVKTMTGLPISEHEFTFTMTGKDEASTARLNNNGEPLTFSTKGNATSSNTAVTDVTTGLVFTQEDAGKTYTYVVKENVPETVPAGWTYDTTEYEVVISVADNNDGTLSVTTTVNGTQLTDNKATLAFNNSYDAGQVVVGGDEAEVRINANKVLNNASIADYEGDFSFAVTSGDVTVATGTNDANGNIAFTPITYTTENLNAAVTEAGSATVGKATVDRTGAADVYTFVYAVSEGSLEGVPGVSYNGGNSTVTVTVTDNRAGALTAAVSYDNDGTGLTFENTYGAGAEFALTLAGNKVIASAEGLNAPKLTGGEYTFTIAGSEGAPMPATTTVANQGSAVSFGPISYTMANVFGDGEGVEEAEAGRTRTFTYTITEAGTLPGVTNDAAAKVVEVTVTDKGDGTLTAAVTKVADGAAQGMDFTFTNTYGVTPEESSPTVDGGLVITKEFTSNTGSTMTAGQFAFELRDASGAVVATGTNGADGKVALSAVTFTAPGTYSYKLSEVNDGQPGVTYDTTTYAVAATVTDNGDGTLSVSWSAPEVEGGMTFTNSYNASPTSIAFNAAKVLSGRELAEGEFSFEVREGGKTILTATNEADGGVHFDAIVYTEPGEHDYRIVEVKGSAEGVTYDETVYTVHVSVTDNPETGRLSVSWSYGENGDPVFRNSYDKPEDPVDPIDPVDPEEPKAPEIPDTGDHTAFFVPAALAVCGVLLAVVALRMRRNHSK